MNFFIFIHFPEFCDLLYVVFLKVIEVCLLFKWLQGLVHLDVFLKSVPFFHELFLLSLEFVKFIAVKAVLA